MGSETLSKGIKTQYEGTGVITSREGPLRG